MGLSAGATNPVFSPLWEELYGTDCLGPIRGVGVVLMVFASALGAVIVGWALDRNTSVIVLTFFAILIIDYQRSRCCGIEESLIITSLSHP